MSRVVGFVPAKGSSSRVPFKNRKTIAGFPLFLWAANNLSRVIPREDVFIDSDCDIILEIARNNGYSTIKRPVELASNSTDGNQLLTWEASNVSADIYIQHLPPMPFCRTSTLLEAVNSVVFGGFDSSFAVHKDRLYQWTETGPKYNIKNIPNSFTLDETISEGMGLYVVNAEKFMEEQVRVAGKFKMIETSVIEKIDIDYPEDYNLASIVGNHLVASNDLEYIGGLEKLLV